MVYISFRVSSQNHFYQYFPSFLLSLGVFYLATFSLTPCLSTHIHRHRDKNHTIKTESGKKHTYKKAHLQTQKWAYAHRQTYVQIQKHSQRHTCTVSQSYTQLLAHSECHAHRDDYTWSLHAKVCPIWQDTKSTGAISNRAHVSSKTDKYPFKTQTGTSQKMCISHIQIHIHTYTYTYTYTLPSSKIKLGIPAFDSPGIGKGSKQ